MDDGRSEREHKILRGDTLSGLAVQYETSVEALLELNGIEDPDVILEGARLKLPDHVQFARPAAAETAENRVQLLPETTVAASEIKNDASEIKNDDDGVSHTFLKVTESEKNWAIRYGAEPTDAHIADRVFGMPKLDHALNQIFHGGVMAAGNHLYIEVGRVDDNGNFETLKRIHGYSIKDTEDGTKLATEPQGKMFTMVVDGHHTGFSDDPIYQMDPHKDLPNQLQSATDDFLLGDGATRIVFQGTQREVMTLYGGLLEATITLNNENLDYDALQNGAPNGNTTHEALRQTLSQMVEALHGETIPEFDPSGLDHFWWGDSLDAPDITDPKIFECTPLQDVMERVRTLEQTAAEQWQAVREQGQDAQFNHAPPEIEIKPPGC